MKAAGRLIGVFAGLVLIATPAAAQSYPEKPIRLVVPYSAGSASDLLGRTVGDALAQALGQPVVIDSRAGNNSVIGSEAVATATPDGYTLGLMTNAGLAASPGGLTGGVRYDPAKDFSYITLVASVSYVWLVNNSVPAKTAPELIQLIKANPGKYNYASGNTGGIAYGGYIKNVNSLDMTHIPYKSTPPALSDLMAGHVLTMVADVASARPMVQAGSVRAIAMPADQRSPLLPDVPTFAESGLPTPPDMSGWWVLVAPAGTPAPILDRLNKEAVKFLESEAGKSALIKIGTPPKSSTREGAAKYQREQLEVWRTMIRELNLKVE